MSKYFNGDKLSGYEDSPITYVQGGNLEECHKVIADLEAKLAESEEQKETLKISQSSTHKTLMQLNDELLKTQKQLAEKERLLNIKDGELNNVHKLWQNKIDEVKQLKQKLAEKDKEYQSFKKIADENVNYLKNRILEETRNYNQDKISFAVEQLEKVKENILSNITFGIESVGIMNSIDNQIEELKKEMK